MQKDLPFESIYNIKDDQWDNNMAINLKSRDFTPFFKQICRPKHTIIEH